MKKLAGVVVMLVLMALSLDARAQAPRPADVELVARFVDQTSVAVVRIDIGRLDTDAVLNDVARTLSDELREKNPAELGVADEGIKKARDEAKAWREKFAAAGGRELYLVLSFNPAADPPLIGIAPTGSNAKADELIALLRELPEPLGRNARAIEGAIIFGPEALLDGKPLAEAERLEEVTRTLKRAGDAPVLVSLIPAEFIRRAIAENMAELPAELGGGPTTVLTKGVVAGWGSLSVAPSWSFKMVAESESEEAAQQLAATLTKAIENATSATPPELGAELRKLLAPRAEGNLVVIAMGNERFASLKKLLVPSMLQARKAARRVVVATNMRQAVMGCFIHAQDHNDQWPKDLQSLVRDGTLPAAMLTSPDRPDLAEAFAYIPPDMGEMHKENPSELVVMYEKYDQWPEQGVWAAYADGHVQLVLDEKQLKVSIDYAVKRQAK